jgi:hypothetical protein
MYSEVTFNDFTDAFRAYDRQDQFTYEGFKLLFDYLEDYEESTGKKIKLDVITICCEYNEYTLDDINREYSNDFETLEDAESWLQDRTIVVGNTGDAIVFACF